MQKKIFSKLADLEKLLLSFGNYLPRRWERTGSLSHVACPDLTLEKEKKIKARVCISYYPNSEGRDRAAFAVMAAVSLRQMVWLSFC